ncbi:MAG: hypothetical protein H6718_29280 [Polyangiaceae bacterium]|nr:hypothetical protein [Polyangiaceae bacterium]MCB9609171.1 hypothetical protein [Polyangiaceae bacterium]
MLKLTQSPARRLSHLASGAALVAGLLVAAPALAEEDPPPYPTCDRGPTEGDIAAAKGAFQAGQAAFNEADYPRAITYWEDAYRRDCTADKLLVNLARAYELNGQLKLAVRALETYNERVPGNPEMAQNQTRIQRFKDKIAKDEAQAATPVPPGTTDPQGTDPKDGDGTQDPGAKVEPPPPGGSKPILPLIIAGGGLAVGIVGAVIYFPAKSDLSDYEQQCGGSSRTCPNSIVDDANAARSKANLGGIITGVGAAALIGGVVWYLLAPEEPATASRVTPLVGKGFTGLGWSGAF